MVKIKFSAKDPAELIRMIMDYLAEVNKPTERVVEEIKPVLTQEQMVANEENAPAHELPPQPTIEEVRDALKQLRDRKGIEAVKTLLKAYNADSVPELNPEDYLGVLDRANVEV